MKTFFISDTHFFHRNLVRGVSSWEDKSGCRDFNTIEEMNETIITNWNKVISKDDLVIHGGDFAFGHEDNTINILKELNGKIHLVKGNHDKSYKRSKELGFIDCTEYWFHSGILVYHYPLRVRKDLYNECKIFLYGHVHFKTVKLEKSKNICCEVINYIPTEMSELI